MSRLNLIGKTYEESILKQINLAIDCLRKNARQLDAVYFIIEFKPEKIVQIDYYSLDIVERCLSLDWNQLIQCLRKEPTSNDIHATYREILAIRELFRQRVEHRVDEIISIGILRGNKLIPVFIDKL